MDFDKLIKSLSLSKAWDERIVEWEMVPGMLMKTYIKTFRTQLYAIRGAGFELVDFIDCKPVPVFKKHDPFSYKLFTKFPLFGIYVSQKK